MLLFYSFTAKYAAPQNHNHAYLEKNESGTHVNVCLEVENLQIFNKPKKEGKKSYYNFFLDISTALTFYTEKCTTDHFLQIW